MAISSDLSPPGWEFPPNKGSKLNPGIRSPKWPKHLDKRIQKNIKIAKIKKKKVVWVDLPEISNQIALSQMRRSSSHVASLGSDCRWPLHPWWKRQRRAASALTGNSVWKHRESPHLEVQPKPGSDGSRETKDG